LLGAGIGSRVFQGFVDPGFRRGDGFVAALSLERLVLNHWKIPFDFVHIDLSPISIPLNLLVFDEFMKNMFP